MADSPHLEIFPITHFKLKSNFYLSNFYYLIKLRDITQLWSRQIGVLIGANWEQIQPYIFCLYKVAASRIEFVLLCLPAQAFYVGPNKVPLIT